MKKMLIIVMLVALCVMLAGCSDECLEHKTDESKNIIHEDTIHEDVIHEDVIKEIVIEEITIKGI